MRRIVLAIAVSTAPMAATSGYAQQTPGQQPQAQQAFQLQQNQQPRAEQEVIAKVNGEAITKPELDATVQQRLAEMQRQAQAQGQQLGPNTVKEVESETLDLLIESRLVEEYAREEGPGAEQQEVTSAVEGVKQQLAAQQVPFEQFLATRGHTPESFEKRIEGSIAWQKLQQQKLSPENVQRYFEENKDKFQAESLEQARPEVIQTFAASLWEDVIKQMKPKADIEMMSKNDGRQQTPAGLPGGNAFQQNAQ